MLDTLVDLVLESLILERLSPAERRVRRSRSMGIELEFGSDQSPAQIAKILNQQVRGRAFGGRLAFTTVDSRTQGVSREFLVTTDATAAFSGDEDTVYDKMEDIARQIAHDIQSQARELSRELAKQGTQAASLEQQDEYEENVDNLLQLLNRTGDPEDLSRIISLIPRRHDKAKQLEEFIDGLEYDFPVKRPQFSEDEIKEWLLDLDEASREELARMLGAENADDLLPPDQVSRASLKDEYQDTWGELTNKYIENRFGKKEAETFRVNERRFIQNKNSIWHGVLVYLQHSRPKEIFNDLKPTSHGVEIVSPRIELSEKGIDAASQLFERAWKALQEHARIIAHEEAGLHVHLGVSDDVKDIHILRFFYALAQNESAFEKAAGRAANYFAESLKAWKQLIDTGAENALQAKDPHALEQVLSELGTKADKYFLANLKSIRTKGTFEVRLGSSTLVASGQLKSWLTLLAKTYNQALKDDYLQLESGVRVTVEGRKIQLQVPDQQGAYQTAVETPPSYALYGFDKGEDRTRMVTRSKLGMTSPTQSRTEKGPITRREPGYHERVKAQRTELHQRRVEQQRERGRRKNMFGESIEFQEHVESLFG